MLVFYILWVGIIGRQKFVIQFSFLTVALALWMGFLNALPPLEIVRGTPHPHDGSDGHRPWKYYYPNIYGGRAQEQWDRDVKRIEFAKYLSTTVFDENFIKHSSDLTSNVRSFVADPFFENFLSPSFQSSSPVEQRLFVDMRIHMTNHQIELIHLMGEYCLRESDRKCVPYVRSHVHDIYAYVGEFVEYYKVINFIFPIPLSGGDVRFIVMDIMYNDGPLTFKGVFFVHVISARTKKFRFLSLLYIYISTLPPSIAEDARSAFAHGRL